MNIPYLRKTIPRRPQFWEEFDTWRSEWTERFESGGIHVLDYTYLFEHSPELFRDYGHLVDPGLTKLAAAINADLHKVMHATAELR